MRVGNSQLKMGCHTMAKQRQSLSFKPFWAVVAPGIARQLHLWGYLKDPSSIGGKQLSSLRVSSQLSAYNWMSYQSNTTSRYILWTIPSCHDALSMHLNEPLFIGSRQLARELATVNRMSYQGKTMQGMSFELFWAVIAPSNSPSTASFMTFEGSQVYWWKTTCTWVGNCQL